jgi:hypothetical protein
VQDRLLIGYGLMALVAIFIAIVAFYAWHNSFQRSDARRRLRDEQYYAQRDAARKRGKR